MTNNDMPDVDMTKWMLEELSLQDEGLIECNELEIYGEDENGVSGVFTTKITDVAENGLKLIKSLESHIDELTQKHEAEIKAQRDKYNELLYEVQSKFPNESRHETALRYIRSAESRDELAQINVGDV